MSACVLTRRLTAASNARTALRSRRCRRRCASIFDATEAGELRTARTCTCRILALCMCTSNCITTLIKSHNLTKHRLPSVGSKPPMLCTVPIVESSCRSRVGLSRNCPRVCGSKLQQSTPVKQKAWLLLGDRAGVHMRGGPCTGFAGCPAYLLLASSLLRPSLFWQRHGCSPPPGRRLASSCTIIAYSRGDCELAPGEYSLTRVGAEPLTVTTRPANIFAQ